jgi:mannitol-1-phosphate 5-dehydrogenase
MQAYERDFWRRCRNPGLIDEIRRIARQPMRKLGRSERLIAPAELAPGYGLPRAHIVQAIAAALAYRHPDDPESMELGGKIERDGIRQTLCSVSGLLPNDPLLDEIESIWESAC